MIAFVCVQLVFAAPATEPEEAPSPYAFNFESADEQGNVLHSRQESGDEKGTITGSYTVIGEGGVQRTVNYVADDDGFRASIQSNEPGIISSAPAGATYQAP